MVRFSRSGRPAELWGCCSIAGTVGDENDVALVKCSRVGLDGRERTGARGVDSGAASATLAEGGFRERLHRFDDGLLLLARIEEEEGKHAILTLGLIKERECERPGP